MQAGTRFTYPEGMEGWVDLGVGYIQRWFTCPSSNHLIVARPGVEPTTLLSQVQCPNHYTTKPPSGLSVDGELLESWLHLNLINFAPDDVNVCCVGGCRTSITHWPCIGGVPLDLYTLYTSVIKLGGWEKVCCYTTHWATSLFDLTQVKPTWLKSAQLKYLLKPKSEVISSPKVWPKYLLRPSLAQQTWLKSIEFAGAKYGQKRVFYL